MSLKLIQSMGIGNPILEKFIIEKIGDGESDIFIEANDCFKDIISHNVFDISSSLELGECTLDEVKAIRKLGFVYLSDSNLNFENRNNRLYSVVPSFKYSKDEAETTTLEYITVYYDYNLLVSVGNIDKYKLIVVSYTEVLS